MQGHVHPHETMTWPVQHWAHANSRTGLYWCYLPVNPVLSSYSFCLATSVCWHLSLICVQHVTDTNLTYPTDTLLLWDSQFLTLFSGTKSWRRGLGGRRAKFLAEVWSQLPHYHSGFAVMPPTTRVWLQCILSFQSPRALPRIFSIVSVTLDDWRNWLNPQDTAVLLEKPGHWLNSPRKRRELGEIYRAALPQTHQHLFPKVWTMWNTDFRQLSAIPEPRDDKNLCIPGAQAPIYLSNQRGCGNAWAGNSWRVPGWQSFFISDQTFHFISDKTQMYF